MATSEPSAPAWRSLPRNVWIITLTSFLTDVSSEMIFNLLPLFLKNVLGVKTNIIGVIEGVAETTASLLKLFSGWLSDRLGERKWLTVIGYGLSTVVKPFLYVVSSWWGVLAVRFSDRVGKGIRTAPRDALIADTIDEKRRGAAFGIHRAGATAGAALGILIALAAGAHDVPITQQRAAPQLTLKGFDRRFRWFLLAVVVFTLGNSADAFVILRAQDRGLSVAGILGMLLTFNLVYALLSGPAGVLSDRIGRRRLILGGWAVYGVLYLGFGLAAEAWQMWVLYTLYGVYYAATEGAAKALVADLVPPDRRGTAYGVYNAAVGIMALPASVIAGVLWQGALGWDGFGASAPFLFGAILALTAVGIFVYSQVRPQAGA